ncbi:Aminoglycoside phosphotransferase [Penicillium viridicatum]|nr:Aminoglycoside phosphotransferase [Penicillium viridicatum]
MQPTEMEPFMRPITHPQSRDPHGIFPLCGKDLNSVTDEALAALLTSAPIVHQLGGTTVVRLSKKLIMKGGGSVLASEAKMLNLIGSRASIRVPQVHRSFQVEDDTKYFGTSGRQGEIASQVAEMIKEIQSIELLRPGPIGGGPCRGLFFTDYSSGPFIDTAEMEAWFNYKLNICKSVHQAPKDTPPFHPIKFVLTHHDLSPRNLILYQHGQVWLVDRAYSGAYPPVFESAALSIQPSLTDFNKMALSLTPRYPQEEVQLDSIEYGLTTAALA